MSGKLFKIRKRPDGYWYLICNQCNSYECAGPWVGAIPLAKIHDAFYHRGFGR
jgi:hypothetical protein